MPYADRRAYMQAFRLRQKAEGNSRVTVNLSREEFALLKQSAAGFDDPAMATHIKRCALAYLNRQYMVPPDIAARLDTVVAILRGVGNNLNQLARHSNEMRYFLDTQEVRLQIRRLEDSVCEFVGNPPRKDGRRP